MTFEDGQKLNEQPLYASKEQLVAFLSDQFDRLRDTNPKMYKDLEYDLYEYIHGLHFDDYTYAQASACFKNNDGTKGPHWTIDDIKSVIKSHGTDLARYNEYDFAYAMNMAYSDFYGAVIDNTETYYKIAKAFLDDKDGPEGKAWVYYRAMKDACEGDN